MRNKVAAVVLILLFGLAGSVYAKEEQPLTAEDVVAKMTVELVLTDEQVKAVKPIVHESISKRQAFLESVAGEFITDKENIKMRMAKFQREENEKLSEVLSEEQMQKLKEKQRLRRSLNQGDIDYGEGVGSGGFTAAGAAMQF